MILGQKHKAPGLCAAVPVQLLSALLNSATHPGSFILLTEVFVNPLFESCSRIILKVTAWGSGLGSMVLFPNTSLMRFASADLLAVS